MDGDNPLGFGGWDMGTWGWGGQPFRFWGLGQAAPGVGHGDLGFRVELGDNPLGFGGWDMGTWGFGTL